MEYTTGVVNGLVKGGGAGKTKHTDTHTHEHTLTIKMAHLPATLQIWFREPKQNNKSALIRWNVPRVKKTRKLEVQQAAVQVNKTILKPRSIVLYSGF